MNYRWTEIKMRVYENERASYNKLFAAIFNGDGETIETKLIDILIQDLIHSHATKEDVILTPETAKEEIALVNSAIVHYGIWRVKDLNNSRYETKKTRSMEQIFQKEFSMRDGKMTEMVFPVTETGRKWYYDARKEYVEKRSLYKYFNSTLILGGTQHLMNRHNFVTA